MKGFLEDFLVADGGGAFAEWRLVSEGKDKIQLLNSVKLKVCVLA